VRRRFPATEDRDGQPLREIRIHAGDVTVSSQPASLFTLLGSCVSVCLHDPEARVGGMNHILLPGRADLSRFDDAARFGINAMELLINRLMKAGARRPSLRAKVFGGARVLPSIPEESSPGRRNVSFVLEFLQMEGIPLVSREVGGERPLRIYFHTHTGEVFLQRVPEVGVLGRIRSEEEDLLSLLARDLGKEGEVELFNLPRNGKKK